MLKKAQLKKELESLKKELETYKTRNEQLKSELETYKNNDAYCCENLKIINNPNKDDIIESFGYRYDYCSGLGESFRIIREIYIKYRNCSGWERIYYSKCEQVEVFESYDSGIKQSDSHEKIDLSTDTKLCILSFICDNKEAMEIFSKYLSDEDILLLYKLLFSELKEKIEKETKVENNTSKNKVMTPYDILKIEEGEYSSEELLDIVSKRINFVKSQGIDKQEIEEEINKILDAYNKIIIPKQIKK